MYSFSYVTACLIYFVDVKVLLTRSPYLASRLNSYTQGLIRSQVPNSPVGVILSKDKDLSDAADMSIDTKTTFFSPKICFPLVCTFDQFLTILQNTIKLSEPLSIR